MPAQMCLSLTRMTLLSVNSPLQLEPMIISYTATIVALLELQTQLSKTKMMQTTQPKTLPLRWPQCLLPSRMQLQYQASLVQEKHLYQALPMSRFSMYLPDCNAETMASHAYPRVYNISRRVESGTLILHEATITCIRFFDQVCDTTLYHFNTLKLSFSGDNAFCKSGWQHCDLGRQVLGSPQSHEGT